MKHLRTRCARLLICSIVLSGLPINLFTIFDYATPLVEAQAAEICDGQDNDGDGQIDEIFGCHSCQSGNRFGFRNSQYCIDWGNHSTDFRTACNQYGGHPVFIDDRAEYDVLAANWNTSFGPSNHYGMLTGSSCSDIRARSDLHAVSADINCTASIIQMDRPSKRLNDTHSDAGHYRTVYCEIEGAGAPQCSDGRDNDGDGLIDFRGGSTTVIEHNGATDPISEGWTRGTGPGSSDGPVINDQGSGINAWFVYDDFAQSGAFTNQYFVRQLTAHEAAQARANGWKLTAKLRVVNVPDNPFSWGRYSVSTNVRIGTQDFVVHYGSEADGDPIVRVSTVAAGHAGESFTLQGTGGGYHLFELIYNPQTQSADLFVDGVKRLSNLVGYQWSEGNFVSWGSGSNPDSGRGHYNQVKFEIFGGNGDPQCESPEDDSENGAEQCSPNDLRILMYAFAVDGREQNIVNEIRSLGFTMDLHNRSTQPIITPALLNQYHTVWFTNGNGGGPVLTQTELNAIRDFYLSGGNIIGQTDESHPGNWTARVNQIVNNVGINHSGHTRHDGHGVCIGLTNREPIVSDVDSIGRATRASIGFTGNVSWGSSSPKAAALHSDGSVAFGFVERENGHGFVFTDPDFTGFANAQCDRMDLYRKLFSHAPCPPISTGGQCPAISYATSVIDFQDRDNPSRINRVLGAPDRSAIGGDFADPGTQFVTVGFHPPITNKAGNDFGIHLVDFHTGEPSEHFEVFVSNGSSSPISLGTVHPTTGVGGQSEFRALDIASSGLSTVTQVTIWNRGPAPADIDAFENLTACQTGPSPQCSDGVDNDGDGKIDFPADSQCESAQDNDERARNFGFCTNAQTPLRSLQGLSQIIVYEHSFASSNGPEVNPFSIGDSRLTIDLNEPNGHDFFTGTESYDVFFSDAHGNLNLNGSYLTIDNFHNRNLTNINTGHNIDAVELRFSDGRKVYADLITRVELGTGLSGDFLTTHGYKDKALGAPDSTSAHFGLVTYLGSGHASMTLGFCGAFPLQQPQCSDGIDNDHDGKKDFPADPGCSSPQDNDETNPANTCLVVRASTYSAGPLYAHDPASLPSNVILRDLDLYRNALQSSDLQDVKLFIYGDANVNSGPFRSLTQGEKSILQNYFQNGGNFTFAADNPTGDEASAGTRDILNSLPANMTYSSSYHGTQSGLHTPNTTLYPFLQGKVFNFTNSGWNSPGDIINISSPAQCVFSLNGRCHGAWRPVQGNQGFVFAEGNAGIGSENYLTNFIRMACEDAEPKPQCSDGRDNDGDHLIDAGDPGCHSDGNVNNGASYTPNKNSETDAPRQQCNDGIDNDHDGKIDFPADPGCSSPNDNDETDGVITGPKLKLEKDLISGFERGSIIKYRLKATNIGNVKTPGTVIADHYPNDKLEFITGAFVQGSGVGCFLEPRGAPAHVEKHVLCVIGDLLPGDSRTVELSFTLKDSVSCGERIMNQGDANAAGGLTSWDKEFSTVTCGGQSSSSSSVHTSSSNSSSSSDSSVSSVSSVSSGGSGPAKLTVDQSGPVTVQKDGTVIFTIKATNVGAHPASGVVIASHKIGGLTFSSGQSDFGCIDHGNHVACGVGTLGGGAHATRKVAYKVTENCGGVVKSKALAQGAGGLSSPVDIDAVDIVCSSSSSVTSYSSSVSSTSSSVSSNSSSSDSSVSSASSVSSHSSGLSVDISAPGGIAEGETFDVTVNAHNAGSSVHGPVVNIHGIGPLELVSSTGATCTKFGNHIHCPLSGDTHQTVTLSLRLPQCTGALNLHGRFEAFDPQAQKGVFAMDEETIQVACP